MTHHAVRIIFGIFTISLVVVQQSDALEFRTIDGSNNNLTDPNQGRAHTPLVRIRDVIANPLPGFDYASLAPSYQDGIDTPRGIVDPNTPPGVGTSVLPNPRDISNNVVSQGSLSLPNIKGASDWLWQWGQFIDHDFSLEEPTPTSDSLLIPINDPNDSLFNPSFPYIPFRRNDPAPGTGAGTGVPREQVNALTAYIDGSNVYGSDQARADFLRTGTGGMMKTTLASNGEVLLPFNRSIDPFPNANPPLVPGGTTPDPNELFLAGDVRANEQVGLTAVHTLFVREHNRLASEIALRSDLDSLMTDNGFDPNIDASLSNEFANAAYRVGHTLLSPQIQLVDAAGATQGSIALRDAFFDPNFAQNNGVELLLKGLAMQEAQDVDAKVIDEVRNFLFAEGNGGLDLPAVNIQRGRDHGLPSYNDARRGLGLTPRTNFSEITSDPNVAAALALQYDSIDDVDLWLGAIAEDAVGDGLLGELLYEIVVDQFTRSRDGDRFFYLNDSMLLSLFPDIGDTRLSDVILRNSSIASMQANAFVAVPEPATWLLTGLALGSYLWGRSRRDITG